MGADGSNSRVRQLCEFQQVGWKYDQSVVVATLDIHEVCVHVYVCVCARLYVHACVCVHTCMCVRACACVCVFVGEGGVEWLAGYLSILLEPIWTSVML